MDPMEADLSASWTPSTIDKEGCSDITYNDFQNHTLRIFSVLAMTYKLERVSTMTTVSLDFVLDADLNVFCVPSTLDKYI